MANRRAIIRSSKASAPAGRPTAGPQGASPYFGAVSPVAMQNDVQNGYAYTYGNFLPRPPATFTQGAFGPFSPILPVPVDTPTESGRAEPRREQYEVGWDLPVGEPGTEGIKLATFPTLRSLADLYSVARACIQTRKSEVRGLEWDIMPTTDAAKANKGNERWFRDFGQRRAQAMKFFRRPDPDYFSWNTFIDAFLEEIFVFDALSLYLRPKRGKGMKKGLFGSDLDCLELLSGPTIRPLYGIHGEYPRPPAPAYQQYLYGVPRSDFMRMITDADIEEAGMAGSAWGQFRGDQLLYLPMTPRRWTPYGFPPIERALIPVMSGLQKQGYALDFFREGTVPAVYISPGDASMTPNQIRELQDALNAFAGDPAFHHKIIVLPAGSKTMPQRDAQLADQFDEVIMNQVCMAFDVMPMELGISPKVSTTMSPGASNQMAKMTSNTAERKSTKPLLAYICDIMNQILQTVCGQDDMEFTFEGLQEEEDQEQLTQLLTQQVTSGLRSIDEARDQLNLQPWGLPETSGPVYLSPTGPIPFGSVPTTQVEVGQPGAPGQPPQSPEAPKPGEGAVGGSGADEGDRGNVAEAPSKTPTKKPTSGGGTDTPGHAMAEATDSEAGRSADRSGMSANVKRGEASEKPGEKPSGASSTDKKPAASSTSSSSKFTVTVDLGKAISNELDALTRHLRKGRQISTWTPKNVPPRTLAVISEHLAKGVGISEAVSIAKTTTIAAPTDAPAPTEAQTVPAPVTTPAADWPGWVKDAALADVYANLIEGAFHKSFSDVAQVGAGVLNGSVAVTRNVLKGIMHAAVAKHVGPVLQNLWHEAWYLGDRAATATVSKSPVNWGPWQLGKPETASLGKTADVFERTILGPGLEIANGIADSRLDQVADAIRTAEDPESLSAALGKLLDVSNRALMIAQTETTRLSSFGAMNQYGIAGVTKLEWNNEPGACKTCLANAGQDPIPVGETFVSGDPCPPQHPRCRCSLQPVAFAGDLSKLAGGAVRQVSLNGQEEWSDPYAAGGGGQSPVRHWGDGTQAPDGVPVTGGVPGNSPGGDFPRWDTPVANGYQGGLNDFSQGVNPAQGHSSGDDANMPYGIRHETDVNARSGVGVNAPTVDRWPSGQTQTQQSPGVVNARPGEDPIRGSWGTKQKADTKLIAAGLAVIAKNTGRVLMLQRAMEDEDPAAGFWEFPGGCLEPGENPLQAAKREWQEEVGCSLPTGDVTGVWNASNGVYKGFVYEIPNETGIPIFEGRTDVANPDDPDRDSVEAVAWWDPGHLANNPAVRPELQSDLDEVLDALGTVTKAAIGYLDGPLATAAEVREVMLKNFPPEALTWLETAIWHGPMPVPLSDIDFSGEKTWAAGHEIAHDDDFVQRLRDGVKLNPIILIDTPKQHDFMIVDGHHRALAYRKLGENPVAYVGTTTKPTGPWDETHSSQLSQGAKDANKSAETPALATTHDPLGTHGLWGDRSAQLPAYIQNIAHAMVKDGHDESSAISMAIGAVKRWAAGEGKVTPEVQAAATTALAEWEKLKVEHSKTKSAEPDVTKDSFEGHHIAGTADTYKHGWIKVGVGVDSSHLSLKKNGDVVHKPTGTVIGHVDKKVDFPNKGTSTFTTSHANGKSVYNGVYKKDAMAAVARYHNHAVSQIGNQPETHGLPMPASHPKKPGPGTKATLDSIPDGSTPVFSTGHVVNWKAPNGDLYDLKGNLQVSASGSTKPAAHQFSTIDSTALPFVSTWGTKPFGVPENALVNHDENGKINGYYDPKSGKVFAPNGFPLGVSVSQSGAKKTLDDLKAHNTAKPSKPEPELADWEKELLGDSAPTPSTSSQHYTVSKALTGNAAYQHASDSQGHLGPKKLNALAEYGKPSGYKTVNPYLNKDGMVYHSNLGKHLPATDAEKAKAQNMIKNLDSAVADSKPTTQDLIVHRRLGNSINDLIGPPGSHVGKTFTNKAYVSTTTAANAKPGNGYGYEAKKTVMDIQVGKGSRVLMGQADEKEVILPRGSKFTVVDDKVLPDGTRHVKVVYNVGSGVGADGHGSTGTTASLPQLANKPNPFQTTSASTTEPEKKLFTLNEPGTTSVHGTYNTETKEVFDNEGNKIGTAPTKLSAMLQAKQHAASIPMKPESELSDHVKNINMADDIHGLSNDVVDHGSGAAGDYLSDAAQHLEHDDKIQAKQKLEYAQAAIQDHLGTVYTDDPHYDDLKDLEDQIQGHIDSLNVALSAPGTPKSISDLATNMIHTPAKMSLIQAAVSLHDADTAGALNHLVAAKASLKDHLDTNVDSLSDDDFSKKLGQLHEINAHITALGGNADAGPDPINPPSLVAPTGATPLGNATNMVDSTDLSMKTNGDIFHKPSKQVIGHVVKQKDYPSKGTTTFTVTHSDGTQVYNGPYKGKSLAALAQHHNQGHVSGNTSSAVATKPVMPSDSQPIVDKYGSGGVIGYHHAASQQVFDTKGNYIGTASSKSEAAKKIKATGALPGTPTSSGHKQVLNEETGEKIGSWNPEMNVVYNNKGTPIGGATSLSDAHNVAQNHVDSTTAKSGYHGPIKLNEGEVAGTAGIRKAIDHPTLTGHEQAALQKYTGSGYQGMNAYLNTGEDDSGYYGPKVEALKLAAERSKTTKPIAVQRNITGIGANKMFGPVGSKVGKTFHDKQFASTTSSANPMDGFGAVRLQYHLKTGTKALDVNKLYPDNVHKNEKEILLAPGQSFTINNDVMINGVRTITLESA